MTYYIWWSGVKKKKKAVYTIKTIWAVPAQEKKSFVLFVFFNRHAVTIISQILVISPTFLRTFVFKYLRSYFPMSDLLMIRKLWYGKGSFSVISREQWRWMMMSSTFDCHYFLQFPVPLKWSAQWPALLRFSKTWARHRRYTSQRHWAMCVIDKKYTPNEQ